MARRKRLVPDSSWKQVKYIGKKKGAFTETGVSTGLEYTIRPGYLVPVHPSDGKPFAKRKSEFKVVW